ncbi:hypothetical protein [Jatrophihabitans sp.]|uniref:hypothetical protein n=1 Tax=Jatrophihabitans sp. TaxID=1932789 RepID=UPI0030C759CD|nr:hypothetical protein [Jatrophihabitans sp.]
MTEIEPGQPWQTDPPTGADVGDFRQGTPASQWALARYLVGRAVAEALGRGLMIAALGVLVIAGLIGWAGSTFWAVVVGVVALGILVLRAALLGVLRRLPLMAGFGALEDRLRALVTDTGKDVLRELRRVGLPSHSWTLPLLALRLIGRRRRETTERLRRFEVGRVVPAARLDELHLLLRGAVGGPTGL